MMREACQVHSILLTFQLFCVLSLLAIVYLQRVIVSRHHGQLSRVVEIERRDMSLLIVGLESLQTQAMSAPIPSPAKAPGSDAHSRDKLEM